MPHSKVDKPLCHSLRSFSKTLLSALAVFALSGLVHAQSTAASTAAPAANVKSTAAPAPAKVVKLIAIVRNKKGKIVPDLSETDFVLTADGSAQKLDYFAKPADEPLTLGLLVDTSPSQRDALDQERSASGPFFDHTVREGMDKAFLIHFDRQVELLQDLTSSPQKLDNAVSLLQAGQPPQFSQTSQGEPPDNDPDQYPGRYPGSGGGEERRDFRRDGTHLYDAIYLAANDLMKKQPGRKAIIVISDGVDRGSKESLEYAIETAQRANTVVYCIYFKGQEQEGYEGRRHVGFGGPGMGGPMGGGMGRHGGRGGYPQQESHVDGKKILDQISKHTGGSMLEISKKLTLDKAYDQIEEELRSQYILGFTPSASSATAGDYHQIELTTKKKGLVVQTRDGYYSAD
jgi:VWFA-related protein